MNFYQVDEEASPVKMKNTTCCVCNFNVFFLRFQRVVFAISTCCVCDFNVLCFSS